MIKNVIFDLVNVLIACDYQKILSQHYPSPYIKRILDNFLHHPHWQKLDLGVIEEDAFITYIAQNYFFSAAELEEVLKKIREAMMPIASGLNLLKVAKQKGYKTFILSNLPLKTMQYLSNKFSIFEQVDNFIVSCDVALIKPNAQIYKYALNHFAINIDQTIFIDDSIANVNSANNIGLSSFQFLPIKKQLDKIISILNVKNVS
jgi:putative hydrolase of the HAD superfamily